jgi:hypothetical protein
MGASTTTAGSVKTTERSGMAVVGVSTTMGVVNTGVSTIGA